MNKLLLLILTVFINLTATQGQPIIDSANFTPLHQEKIFRNKCNYLLPFTTVTSGANVTWDFTTLITASTDSIIYVHPDSTGWAFNNCYQHPSFMFPTKANFSVRIGNVTYMFSYTLNGMVERGWCTGMDLMGFLETVRFPFPLTYNDSSLNIFYGSGFSSNPFPGYSWTDSTVYKLKAIGYGSLALPNTTYNNSLLINVIQINTRTDAIFCQSGCTYIDTIFYWLVPNIQHPVLQINYPKQFATNNALYISQIVLDTKEITRKKFTSVFPNPFHFSMSLELNFDFENADLKIYNTFGEQVKRQKIISQTTTINREGLADGLYFYQVTSDKGIVTSGRMMIE